MLQNFKTDIIYYNTPTDFELEFNLCGCCRMRLFNEKCADKKTLLLALSRAVSRSRIIIITAPLFGVNSVTPTIATAIGTGTEIVDNAAHNINSMGEIEVIKGSVPLVTDEGIYGGCIIESGPQSLILLTDNKSVRKTIMKTLIHPYVEDIARSEGAPKKESDEDQSKTTPVPTEAVVPEIPLTEVAVDAAATIIAGEALADDILPDTDLPEEGPADAEPLAVEFSESEEAVEQETTEAETENDTLQTDLFTEVEDPGEEDADEIYYHAKDNELFTDISSGKTEDDSEDTDYNYYEDEYYTDQPEAKPSPFNIWMLVISLIILVALAILCFCIFYVPTKQGISPSAYLREVFGTMFG